MAKAPDRYTQNVFINCPFDGQYKPLFEAAVFAVQIAGFEPRCAQEAANAGQNRLQKIMDIIADCQYGFHDISRTEPGTYQLPRFNMPLDLGLDLGCRRYGAGSLKKKKLLVVDRKRHRYQPRPEDGSFEEVPDLVVEVFSPKTRRLDRTVKLAAYREAGVPEVWFADPRPRTIQVLTLSADGKEYVEQGVYGMGGTVTSAVLPACGCK